MTIRAPIYSSLCTDSPALRKNGLKASLLGQSGVFLHFLGVFGTFLQTSQNWSAANGGVTNGGLRGVWPPFPEIGRNRPFSPFFCLFRPFPEGLKSTWKIQKTEEKGLFPQISSDFLKPPSLKPPFAAPQQNTLIETFLSFRARRLL